MNNTIPTIVDVFGSEVQLHDKLTLTYGGELKTGHLEVFPFLYFTFDEPTKDGVASASIGHYPVNQWLLEHGAEKQAETYASKTEVQSSIDLLSKLLHFQRESLSHQQRETILDKIVTLTQQL